MPRVPSIAQSDGWRIAVSVKILEAAHASYVEQSRDMSHIQKQGTEMALPQKNLHPTAAQRAFRELHEKENEHCIRWLSLRRSNATGDGRNAIILPGAPRKSRSGVPASDVQCGAIFGSRSLGPLWRKGSLGLDRAYKRHSALSMRNILAS